MKACPKCGEMLGNNVEKCFKCNYVFNDVKKVAPNSNHFKRCPVCDNLNPSSQKYCKQCGHDLNNTPSNVQPTVSKENTKREDKLERFMSSHHLDSLSYDDVASAKEIATGLLGNNLIEWGTIFSGKAEDVAKLSYLRALVEQNWMIINQLDRLNKKLDDIGKK